MAKIVIALGGNALGETPSNQKETVNAFSPIIIELLLEGHEIVIAHGNGPQVGMINQAFGFYEKGNKKVETMPFAECGAMSQGYIGYHIQNALLNEVRKIDLNSNIVTCLTQVLVDKDDKAFKSPSKPIGSFYTKEEADRLEKENGYTMMEDAGRGYRRVVASPKPVDILEKEAIQTLISSGNLVIACGGGGIPVIADGSCYKGIDAVIDKDYASEKLAELIDADILLILTAVDNVYINFGTDKEKALKEITVSDLEELLKDNHFKKGSMLPKVEACIQFVKSHEGKKAIITSIEKAKEAINGNAGTIIK